MNEHQPTKKMNSPFIQNIRKDIDSIDAQLLELLARRMQYAVTIGNYKNERDLPVVQGNRWKAILKKAMDQGVEKGLDPNFVKAIWNAIHDESVRIQKRMQEE